MIRDETEYCTVAEAARLLRVSVPTVWRWINSERLPAVRIGQRALRIRRSDLEEMVRPARPADKRHLEPYTIHMGDPNLSAEELLETLRQGRENILARRGGKPFPSSVELIRQAREERYRQL